MQMINHGITTGALFCCVGLIYERTHSRLIADNIGLAGPMPRYATCLTIFALSSLGLPGTNSFVGEFLILAGTFVWSKFATTLAALGMMGVQALVHLPVPSTSGQAVLTMPLLVPLSDLIGLSRQVTVLAYQYGAGLCELLTPTNGALMAMLAASGVRYETWIRFVGPVLAALAVLGAVGLGAAVATGLR